MDAYDLVISIFALNSRYNSTVQQGGISKTYLTREILSKHPHPVLEEARIAPHEIHQDSQTLEDALNRLLACRVLSLWVPGNVYTWDFPQTPAEYFDKNVKPKLSEDKLGQLKKFCSSLTQ